MIYDFNVDDEIMRCEPVTRFDEDEEDQDEMDRADNDEYMDWPDRI